MPAILSRTSASCSARERLTQRRVGERFRLLATPGGMQPDCRLGDQWPSQRMPSRCEFQCALTQVGGGPRVGGAERLGRLEQGRDGDLVPGSALSASCVATSTGSAPPANSTEAAWRSRERRTERGTLARTASKGEIVTEHRACRRVRPADRRESTRQPAPATLTVTGRALPPHRRGRTSVPVRRPRSPLDEPRRTSAPAAGACSGSHGAASATRPTRPVPIRPERALLRAVPKGARRAGTGCRPPARAIFSSSPSGSAPKTSAVSLRDPRLIQRAEDDLGRTVRSKDSTALRSCGRSLTGRRAITQPIGTVARRAGKARSAAAVPLSAHWTSSRQTSKGASSAARSSSASRSCSSQYLCSGEACASPNAVRSRIGEGPSNRASISTESWTTVSPGSAVPEPTLYRQAARHRRHLPRRRLLPIPAPPSTKMTVPTPERSWSRCWPRIVTSVSSATDCLAGRTFDGSGQFERSTRSTSAEQGLLSRSPS